MTKNTWEAHIRKFEHKFVYKISRIALVIMDICSVTQTASHWFTQHSATWYLIGCSVTQTVSHWFALDIRCAHFQSLNEKIEERNEELLKLRKKTTTTVQILTHVREKLQVRLQLEKGMVLPRHLLFAV